MWPDLSTVQLFIRPGRTDFRKQINGLSSHIQSVMLQNPLSGNLYLFCNGDRDRIKAVYWDKNGFCMWQKKLEKGRFPWPDGEDAVKQLSIEELRMILCGIDFRKRFKELHYSQV